MPNAADRTVGEIVGNDHRTANVFEKYSIDFCCGGKQTLKDACREKGIDPDMLAGELEQVATSGSGERFRPEQWDLDALADFIVNNHHNYIRRAIPQIHAHLDKIVSVHGNRHPELSDITSHFLRLSDELTRHMQKEEVILFPYIKTLAVANRMGGSVPPPPFQSVRHPIAMMEAEHQGAGDLLVSMRVTSDNYTPPSDGCETYRVTFKELQDFERDLHRHIHLENNILFPKAIGLEGRLLSHSVRA